MTAMSTSPQSPLATTRDQAPAPLRKNETSIAIFPGDRPGDPPLTAMVKTGPRGLIRQTMTRVQLREERGEVYRMGMWNPKSRQYEKVPILTAAGYDKLNMFGGVSFVCPETVMGDDGTPRPNPYLHRIGDDIKYVRVRMIAMGRNPQGNLVALDTTLNYDLSTYFAQDLMSKWTSKKSDTTKAWGKLVATGSDAINGVFDNQQAYAMPGGLTLIVDISSKDVLSLIQEHINRQKFAERNAQTIVRRNLLKRFYAAAKLGERLTVAVVGWPQIDRELRELRDVAMSANSGKISLDGEVIDVDRTTADVSSEEADAALAGQVDEDMSQLDDDEVGAPGVDVPQARKPFEPPLSTEVEVLREKFTKAIESGIDVDKLWAALGSIGIDGDDKRWSVADWKKAAETAETMLIQKVQKKTGMSSEKPKPVSDPKPTAKTKTKTGEQGELIPGGSKPDTNLAARG